MKMMEIPLPLYRRSAPPVATTPEIDALLARTDTVVGIGVSGGKDSTAATFATTQYLHSIDYRGKVVMVHADLGVTEWPQSIEWCKRLADRLNLELIVVRRAKGDMMERWEQRWADNVARYAALKCVKLILPWSTPGMRFCTSELKVAPICAGLTSRFPGHTILSVTGIRRQESDGRQNAPVAKVQPKLTSVTRRTSGIDWHPIPDWSLQEVFDLHDREGFPLHPAYTDYGMTRVSCMECIMQSDADARAVMKFPGVLLQHRRVVSLEIKSTFAFQGNKWRADIAPDVLSESERERLVRSKANAEAREVLESLIPKDLLYTKGWPLSIPTRESAELLCGIRRQVAGIMGLTVDYTDPQRLIDRYIELWTHNQRRAA